MTLFVIGFAILFVFSFISICYDESVLGLLLIIAIVLISIGTYHIDMNAYSRGVTDGKDTTTIRYTTETTIKEGDTIKVVYGEMSKE